MDFVLMNSNSLQFTPIRLRIAKAHGSKPLGSLNQSGLCQLAYSGQFCLILSYSRQ